MQASKLPWKLLKKLYLFILYNLHNFFKFFYKKESTIKCPLPICPSFCICIWSVTCKCPLLQKDFLKLACTLLRQNLLSVQVLVFPVLLQISYEVAFGLLKYVSSGRQSFRSLFKTLSLFQYLLLEVVIFKLIACK